MVEQNRIGDHFFIIIDDVKAKMVVRNLKTGHKTVTHFTKTIDGIDVPMLNPIEVKRLKLYYKKIERIKNAVPNHQNRTPKSQNQSQKKLIHRFKVMEF